MSTSLAATSALLIPVVLAPRRRRRVKFRDARPRLRMGIRRALNSGRVTDPAEADALAHALEDDDVLEEAYSRSRQDLPDDPAPGRDWGGFFGALANFIAALAPIIMAILKMFLAMTPAAASLDMPGRSRRALQHKFSEHPDGPELHAMALSLVPSFRLANFDFADANFQSTWRQFSNAIHSALSAFDPTAVGALVKAMHDLEEALANYDGYADLPHIVMCVAAVLQASLQLFGA